MNPKAIIKFPKRSCKKAGPKAEVSKEKDAKYPSTLERLTYCFLPKKEIPEDEVQRDIPDRVLWIEGELGDLGYPVRDAALMAEALDFGHGSKLGRKTRGLILSAEPVSPEDEHLRAGIFQRLRDSLVLLAERLGITHWIAIAHDDKPHPHVHFIFRNWDDIKRRRLDIRPTELSEMQSMDWTNHLESGRGSKGGNKKGAVSKRGKELQEYRDGMAPKQKVVAARKEAPIKALQKFLNDKKIPSMDSPQDLAKFLFDCPSLPSAWERTKLLTKKGGPRSNPAIIIAGEGLKLKRFFEFIFRERKKKKKFTAPGKQEHEQSL
ncbi:MAG: hypothetical protein WCP35_18685 [Verrucomicrobiota bacterium]